MNKFDQKVIKMYNEENKSTYEIAKLLETYPNKIRRTLIKNGEKLKDKSEAQKTALAEGRSSHPTMGRKRSKDERIKISSSLVDYWGDMTEKERKRRSKIAKKNWNSMTSEQKETMRSKGIAAIQLAATNGSKLEQFIKNALSKNGYSCESHVMIIPSENLEIAL